RAADTAAHRRPGEEPGAAAREGSRRMIAAADFPRTAGMSLLDRLAQLGVPLADITADSRAVKLGAIFVAYPGTVLDGRSFIPEAIARGAAAVLWERTGFNWLEAWEVPNLGVENLRGRISEIA